MTILQTPHTCPRPKYRKEDHGGYGTAVDEVLGEDEGELWIGNGEYWTRVNFCPFCGYKAKVPVPP